MMAENPEDVETGARIAYSALTDTTYLVTKWVDQGDGDIVSLEKEEIETLGIRECDECGETGDPDEEYGVEGVARIGGNWCLDCLVELAAKQQENKEGSDA